MSADEIRARTQGGVGPVLQPAAGLEARRSASKSLKARLAFVLISKLYRQMYANTGIATDSARVNRRQSVGAPDRQAVPASVHGAADAGPAATRRQGHAVGSSRARTERYRLRHEHAG